MTGIIILNYFSHQDTIQLYRKLSEYPDLKLLVVDNSCSRREAEALKKKIPADALLFSPKNMGYAGGNNLGIRTLISGSWPAGKNASGKALQDIDDGTNDENGSRDDGTTDENGCRIDLIALLNPDVYVESNIFPALREQFDRDPSLAAAGPRLCIRDDRETIYSDGGRFTRNGYLKPGHIHGGMNITDFDSGGSERQAPTAPVEEDKKMPGSATEKAVSDESGEQTPAASSGQSASGKEAATAASAVGDGMEYVNGSFIVLRRAALEDVGEFNEKFFLYFEEADWCQRAREGGWSLKTCTDVTAWQRISEKERTYNYYFFRSWFLFLHLYDKDGVGPLLIQQLKKIKWILQDPEIPWPRRVRIVRSRFAGVVMGYFNL